MNPFKRLKEGFFPSKKTIGDGTAVLGTVEQSYGVRLKTSFRDQLTVFNEDPVIKESVLQFAEQVVSTGIFTTLDEYDTKLPVPEDAKGYAPGAQWTAKECIDNWNRANNLDGKILTIAAELDAFGNSFWNITDGFTYIPIEAVDWAQPKTKTKPIRDEYNLKLTGYYSMKELLFGDFVHFSHNTIGTAPFGTGILYSLIQIPQASILTKKAVPSLYELRKAIRASMKEGFEKFSFANELWSFEGLSDTKTKEVGEKLTKMASTGQRIATNVKGSIGIAVPQRTATYDAWIKTMEDEFLMSLANPSLKLGLEMGFTKATAEAAQEMFESKIESLRREIRRQIEAVWIQVLTSCGFDPFKANVKLHFGSPEVEYETDDLFKAVEDQIISKEEARTILRESMKWRLESITPVTIPAPPVEPAKVPTNGGKQQ